MTPSGHSSSVIAKKAATAPNWDICATVFLFILVSAAGLWRIQYGLGHLDEGMYVGAPYRYVLGDTPFVHEKGNPASMFDIVLWPLFSLFKPSTLYEVRFLGFLVRIAAVLPLFFLLKRYTSPILAALACAVTVNLGSAIYSPGYNYLGRMGLLVSMSLWLVACLERQTSRRMILSAALAGFFFVIGALSYTPLIIFLAFPALTAVFAALKYPPYFMKQYPATLYSSVLFLASTGLLLGVLVILASQIGVLDNWWQDFTAITDKATSKRSPLRSLKILGRFAVFSLPTIITAWILLWSFTTRFRGRLSVGMRSAGIVAGSVLLGIFVFHCESLYQWFSPGLKSYLNLFFKLRGYAHIPPAAYWTVSLCLAMTVWTVFGGPKRRDDDSKDENRLEWNFVRLILVTVGISYFVLLTYISTNQVYSAQYAVALLLPLGTAAVGRHIGCGASFRGGKNTGYWGLVLILVFSAVIVHHENFQIVYRDKPAAELTAPFKHRALKHIYSTPEKVERIDGLLEYLDSRLKNEKYLLVPEHFPILYFLTRTRPALPRTWAPKYRLNTAQRQNLLDEMLQRRRIAKYAVIYRAEWQKGEILDPKDPIHKFIREHYRPIAEFGEFKIYELRDDFPVGE